MFKSCLILAVGGLIGLLGILLLAGYWAGAFNVVHLETTEQGPYRIAYLDHPGTYADIAETVLKVEKLLAEQEVAGLAACALYYGDVRKVPDGDEVGIRGGYVVERDAEVEPPLEIVEIPRREVLFARFEGHPNIARARIAHDVAQWFDEHPPEPGRPFIEFFLEGMMEAEVPLVEPSEHGKLDIGGESGGNQ